METWKNWKKDFRKTVKLHFFSQFWFLWFWYVLKPGRFQTMCKLRDKPLLFWFQTVGRFETGTLCNRTNMSILWRIIILSCNELVFEKFWNSKMLFFWLFRYILKPGHFKTMTFQNRNYFALNVPNKKKLIRIVFFVTFRFFVLVRFETGTF